MEHLNRCWTRPVDAEEPGRHDHRLMYDVIDTDRVVLVLGIVDRADLERWLRSR
jgi:hypothetical protein